MSKKRYLIVTIRSWNIKQAADFKRKSGLDIEVISEVKDFTAMRLKRINPRYVFLPHWSRRIPRNIYRNWECIVFHMTDLPFGRGGSPLQNLIQRGIYKTKISALRVNGGLDTGPVYLKSALNLSYGSAGEIYRRAAGVIFTKMIPLIIKQEPKARPQRGKAVFFKRRTPEQSDISGLSDLKKIYDHIRMLDAEGYPAAFLDSKNTRFSFSNARMGDRCVAADVKIIRTK